VVSFFSFFPYTLHHITSVQSGQSLCTPTNHIKIEHHCLTPRCQSHTQHTCWPIRTQPIMSGPESFAIVAPLHQLRVSQIPLRPSEHAAVCIDTRNAFSAMHNQDRKSGPIEMQSSLDHVRYNIVGKCSPSFLNRFPGLSRQCTPKLRWTAMPDIYHQASSRFDGIWGTNAQDR